MVDWVFTLAIATFVLVVAFLWWNKKSAENHTGATGDGVGGVNDPLSGATGDLRSPGEMTAAMQRANAAPHVGFRAIYDEDVRRATGD